MRGDLVSFAVSISGKSFGAVFTGELLDLVLGEEVIFKRKFFDED